MTDAFAASPGQLARTHLRATLKASLGTIDRATGTPYVSLVTIATDVDGSPLLLLSGLARHTANLGTNARASLLLDSTDAIGDPVSGARLTLMGRLAATGDVTVRQRYLARHPEAAMTADFADFRFWRFAIASAHLIAGFGRIHTLPAEDVTLTGPGVGALAQAQVLLLEEVAALPAATRHGWSRRAVEQRAILGLPVPDAPRDLLADDLLSRDWHPTGVDPEGLDLRGGTSTLRLSFDAAVRDLAEARSLLREN